MVCSSMLKPWRISADKHRPHWCEKTEHESYAPQGAQFNIDRTRVAAHSYLVVKLVMHTSYCKSFLHN